MPDSEQENDGRDRHPAYGTEHHMEMTLRSALPGGTAITRPALVRKLLQTPPVSFVLISAPVGYGKSTLLAHWSSHQRNVSPEHSRPFAAVTLDNSDNDPVSFWTAVVYSVTRTCPDVESARLTRMLRTPQPDIENVVLPSLLEEIDTNCPYLILALDNYQSITEPECHEQLDHLRDQLPGRACLVLATRTDPPLPLARLRAAGDIVEIRMSELRFEPDEVAQIILRVSGHQLRESDLDKLVENTEGWPTVVYLAARLLRNQSDPSAFIEYFGGNNRYVMDYLEEEVLRYLPGEVQRFLARTSILDRFTARLCDAVAGTANSADLLDGLERSNLFLLPLDGVRTWYRYHHLFRQTLREQLTRTEPGATATLHQKASAWYERAGDKRGAIEHALAASDGDRAIGLIGCHWAHHLYRGESATIRNWLSALGENRAGQSPLTAICAAWMTALSGERLVSHRWLRTAERLGHRGPLPDGMQSVRGAVALYQATFGFGGVTEMLAAARTATDLHTDPTSPWYAQARVALGYSRYLAGDLHVAVPVLEDAAQAGVPFPVLRILALSVLSLVTGDLGRATQAADLANAAQELLTTGDVADSSEVTLARIARTTVLIREGHLLRARQELEHALRVRRAIVGLPPWPTITALALLARVVLTLGYRDEARALLDEATDLLKVLPAGSEQVRTTLTEIERRLSSGAPSATTVSRLTDREQSVLRLLQGSLPLREVATQLFVTVNTVKSHTRLIYRKLGVSSRTEAIRRARELGLL